LPATAVGKLIWPYPGICVGFGNCGNAETGSKVGSARFLNGFSISGNVRSVNG